MHLRLVQPSPRGRQPLCAVHQKCVGLVAAALVTLCTLTLSSATQAAAQSPDPETPTPKTPAAAPAANPSGPALVPPKVSYAPDVKYPDNAQGDAEVILFLEVNVDGTVRSAEVDRGDEPFASAARQAAGEWRFSPATRNGKPVAAKIRYRVSFIEEKVVVPPPAPLPSPAPLPPPPKVKPVPATPPSIGVIEVDVTGARDSQAPSVSSLKRAEVRQLPGAFGDPFRAIEVLPGVTPIVSGLPFFYVRGAPPGNIGYFLDGVRVPYLFHVGAGPSVVHPAIVDRVDLYAGGFPSRFGRYSGAIVSAEATEPTSDWHGEAVLRLVDAGALVEGGTEDGRVTALVGGRYSYTAGLFSLISPNVTLDYRDFQVRASYDITPRDRISLFAFGAYDFLSNTEEDANTGEEIETVLFGSEFYRVDGRYDVRLPNKGRMRAALTWGFDQTRLFGTRNSENMLMRSRVRLVQPLIPELTVRAGFDIQVDNYTADPLPYTDPDNPAVDAFDSLFPPRADTGMAGWVDVTWKPSKHFEITPGLRFDSYFSEGAQAMAVDPRLSVVVTPVKNVRILHSFGVANQPPSFVVPIPGLAVASLRGGLQTSFQASSGVELGLPGKITASLSAYTGLYLNMTDTIGSGQNVDENSTAIPRSLGSSKGFEVYIRRSLTERLGGFISYTFSRTTRSVGSERLLATFDRPHVVHAAAGYKLGRGWQAGLRFSAYSGALIGNFPGNEDGEEAAPRRTEGGLTLDQNRDPIYYRFDFRVEKKWKVYDTAWMSFVAEMVNATLNPEIIGGQRVGPVSIPSIGLEGGF